MIQIHLRNLKDVVLLGLKLEWHPYGINGVIGMH